MADELIARPYAKAVFELALEGKLLNEWSQLLNLLSAISQDAQVKDLLNDPRFTCEQRSELFADVCFDVTIPRVQSSEHIVDSAVKPRNDAEQVETHSHASPLTKIGNNFIQILSYNARLGVLPKIASIYEQLKAQEEGVVAVDVVAAMELDKAQKEQLEQVLSKKFTGRVLMNCKIDKELIGGVIVKKDDLVIDGSVSGQINKLRKYLLRS